MHAEFSNDLYDRAWGEHPVYWVRLWTEPPGDPQHSNTAENSIDDGYLRAWNADSYRITDAVDIQEVLAWAESQTGWAEVFVETDDGDEKTAVVIAGFNPSRADGRLPQDYISDPVRAGALAERLRANGL